MTRWEREAPPSELEVMSMLEEEGLEPRPWGNAAGATYRAHRHPYHKVLYVLRGEITFAFPGGGEPLTLRVGDRLDLPEGTSHEATVGPEGVTCFEGHKTET